MKRDCLKHLLTVTLLFFAIAASAQMPSSPCGQSGGKRADVLGAEARYSSPGASAPVFTIPAGTKSISVYISSETGTTSGGNDFAQGDEDFISVNAVIDLTTNTSSGYVNFAKNTFRDGSGTNLYGWQQAPLGAFIPAAAKIGDANPELNNVNFSILGNTLTITQSLSGVHSSFYVQYLSPYSNSLTPLEPQVKALLHGAAPANTDLVMPIPTGADVIFISGKGTNSSYGDLNTTAGTEEGYSNLRFTIDLQKGTTTGFITLANGGSANRRSTYVVNNLSSSYSNKLVGAGAAVTGDNTGKSMNDGAVGMYNPAIYVSGSNLVIKRDANYARDFDDAYVVEFYKRAGQGMSAEFISSDVKVIPTGLSSTAGVSRTFDIPPGTNAIYFTQGGNAVNMDSESNENSLEAFAYIDLAAGTATGYFYQQVGLSQTERRDDNFAFKGVPLNNTSARSHAYTVGFKGPYNYDISFSLSADKSQLTVTNKTGLANPDYQLLLSIDNYGSKPDIAFGTPGVAFTKYSGTKTVKADVTVCNPGAGNSGSGMPVSFYHGDPTTNPSARLLYTGTFSREILAGECQTFSFDLDLSNFDNLNIDLTIIINDNGSYVPGGVGNEVGVPFTLASLASQHATYQECYYENNLVTRTIAVNNAPVLDPDPNNSSGATGAYSYLNFFDAGSTGAGIMDADMTIVDPDAPVLSGATITLTNSPDAAAEALYLNGTLPAGITMTGNNTNVVQLSGQASQADYIAVMKMLEYRNSNNSPNTADRIITAVVTDGTETSPVSTTTIVILTSPRINVKGNDITIEDNSTEVTSADGTDFGIAAGSVITHTFTIHNVGTGTINLTAPVSITGAGFSIAAQPAANAIASGQSTQFAISYDPAGRAGGNYTAVVRIRNNDADAGRADYTFTVAAIINILPVISDNSVSGFEDKTYVFKAADFTAAYSDGNGTPLSVVRIESLPQNGSLQLDGVPVTIGEEILFSDLGHLTFVPQGEWNGSTGFNWSASDGTAYAAAMAGMAINIAPENDAPVITLPANTAVTEDIPATIKDILFEDIDVATGNVTVTFSVAGGQLNAVSGASVMVGGSSNVLVLSGSLADINAFLAAGMLTYDAPQAAPASLDLIVNISDNGNTGSGGALQDTKSMVLNITPVNDAPTGTGDTKTTNEDTPVSGTVTGADADGDQLTFSKATDPSNGSVVVNADGTYTYTPNADYRGSDNFTITISDGNGGSTIVTVNITVSPVNDIPTGTGDTKTTNEDTPVSGTVTGADADGDQLTFIKATDPSNGSVLVNTDGTYTYTPNADYQGSDNFTIAISDGNGGSATVTVNITVSPVNDAPTGTGDTKTTNEDTPVNGTVTGADVDNDQLTFTKATDPSNGTVIVNTDGTYIYTPNADYRGSDNFTITINDGNGGTAIVTVNITVSPVNDAPTGNSDTKTTNEDTPVSGTVTGADADGDQLTFTKATDPSHGTATLNTDGTYTYIPYADYRGSDNFTVTISDGNGGAAVVTVNITVSPVNDAPSGTGDAKTTNEDTPVNGTVTGADADGDQLTFIKATDPSNGSALVNADGTYTYTPNADYRGADNFTITINDGNGGTAIVTVNITVSPVNDAPAGTGDNQTTDEETPVSGTVTGADADGDQLSFSKATDPSNGTVSVNVEGTYTYTPNADYQGSDNFTITINDGNGGSTTVTVNITVSPVNDAPTGTGDTKTTNEDIPVNGTVTGADIDGDHLTFTKATNPANGTATVNIDGTYTYTPNTDYQGSDNFTITISDGNGGSTIVTVNITVSPVNDAPAGNGDTKTTNEDTPVSGTVTGADADGDQLTFTKATDPSYGSVTVNTDGTYIYAPNANYQGADNFTVTINDGNGGSATVAVNITVSPVNDAPTGTGDAKSTNEDIPVNGTVTGADADGDQLTFSKATDPTNGAATVNTDGTYIYTPNADYRGSDNFTITINDGNGGTAIVTVNITVSPVNDAPTGTGDTKATNEDTPVNGTVTGADADGDQLTFTKATDPSHGTAMLNTDGTYTYTPYADYQGSDNFTVTIGDGNGGAAVVTVNITVSPVNDAPSGTGDTKTTNEDTPVNGTVTGADTDGDHLTFTKASDPSNGAVVVNVDGTYIYTPDTDYQGSDIFTITISDGNGGSATVAVNITVSPVNDAPAGTGDTRITNEETPVSGRVTGADADGDHLTFTKSTDPANGAVSVNVDGTYIYTPDANYHGSDNFTIEIGDGNSGSATVTVNITVSPVNDAPTGNGDNKTTNEDVPVNGSVAGADADGDQLTFSKTTDPANGTATVNADGTYTYNPNGSYHGSDNFTITISDGNGGTATVTVNITVLPVNDAPMGTDDARTTNEDTPVNGAVTGSDADGDRLTFTKATDPANGSVTVNTDGTYIYTPNANYQGSDNFTITISDGNSGITTVTVNITVSPVNDTPAGTGDTRTTNEDTPVSGAVTGADLDGDNLTFTSMTGPSNGTVAVTANGGYTYTPNADYKGPDSFTISISDGNGGTVAVSVNITVLPVNDVPAGNGDNQTTNEDLPLSGTVTGSDIDGDQLTFSKATDPSNGSVVVNADGTYIYTPNVNYQGSDNFTVTISDGNGGSTTVTVNMTVLPVNDIPTGTGDTKTTNEDTPVSGTVTGADADGDQLTFSKATDPSNGSVLVNTDGTYTYTPNADYQGSDNFTIAISDGNGGSATVTVNITVSPVNDAPTGTGDTKTTNEDTPVNGTVTGADVDNDQLTFSKATDPSHGTATLNTDGTYTYIPYADYRGSDNFTVTISDGNGGAAVVTVNITVSPVNDAPTGTGDAKSTNEDTPVNGTVTGADADGDQLTFSKATNPANGTVSVNADGTYTYTPNADYQGSDNFTVMISDGNGGSAAATVNITVLPVNDTPTGKADPQTINEDAKAEGKVTGIDTDGDNLTFSGNTNPAHGEVVVNPDGTYVYTPDADYKGPDSFTVGVSDGNGGTAIVTVNIQVSPVNDAPTGTGDAKTTQEDKPVNGTVTGLDADGDQLTFTRASEPAHGVAVVNPDGSYTYTPAPDYNGADVFTVGISDGHGGHATVLVNITVIPVNDIPTGTGDTRTTPEDTPVSGAVKAKTSDRVELTFSIAATPAHGRAEVKPDGTYTYTPNTNYHGPDEFFVAVADQNGGTVKLTVNILVTPVNDMPVGTGDDRATIESTPVRGFVTGADIDGDALTFTRAADPLHGSVVINSDGTYTYAPVAGYTGADNFSVNIADGRGGTVTVTVNIQVTPMAGQITLVKTAALRPDNASITYTFTVTNTGNTALHNITISDAMLGFSQMLQGGLQPGASTSMSAVYKLTQEDRERGRVSNTAEVTALTPVNKEVKDRSGTDTDNDSPTQTKVAGAPLAVNDEAGTRLNTPVIVPVLDNDNAGSSAFNRRSLRIITRPQHGQVVILGDGRVTYLPENSYSGDDAFTYRVQDMEGYTTNMAAVKVKVEVEGLQIPTLFTPNGDGKNDVFEIRGLHKYAENELVIVNRWGTEVYRQKNYQQTWKGDGLTEGTYYYLLRVKKAGSQEWEVFKGYTTLLRKFKQ